EERGGPPHHHMRSGQRAFSESEALPSEAITMKNDFGGGSVSSVCSIGSWTTENSGYRTIRGIHSRRRPLLSESEDHPETTALSNAQVAVAPELSVSGDSYRRSSGGLIRRKDSWTHKSKSLDYRLTRLRKNNNNGGSHPPTSLSSSSALPSGNSSGQHINNTSPEPQYRGITLPSLITALFPHEVLLLSSPLEEDT
ncbi:Rapamycininsensitive companion of mTORlike, partial [Caligus rogercresseyi]